MNNQFIPLYYEQREGLLNALGFKAYHRCLLNENKPTSFEYVISSISSVVRMENGIKAMFDDGTAIYVGFDGSYVRYNKLGQKQSSRKVGSLTGMSFQNFHVYIFIYGKAISLERFVAVCRDIINDRLAVNYSDLTANVMDGSGSLETADYLNIPYNLDFENIEWCSKSKNAAHGQKIKKLFEITGHVYRFSAEDAKEKRLATHTNSWTNNNGGSIPSNCLIISNSESNCKYLRTCRKADIRPHPARFPSQLAEFFIKLLTDEDDLVIDIFAGSNTTGAASKQLNRRWRSFKLRREYVAASVFRFLKDNVDPKAVYNRIMKVKEDSADIPRF